MLSRLSIQNYAIIDELEISFSPNMNVITGETGAGKSIIAGALGLILGARADSSVLVNKERKCIVEGIFHAENKKPVHELLAFYQLDESDDLVIRREIATNGKSRAFINDTPVNLSQLQELSALLVDLHQQFDTLALANKDFQAEVMDALANQFPLLDQYRNHFQQWKQLAKELSLLKEEQARAEKEADYNQFQFNELASANLKEDELESIEAELKLLNNAGDIGKTLEKAFYELEESDAPLVQQLKVLVNQLSAYGSFHPELQSLIQRLQSAQIELQDIASGIDQVNRQVNYDPAKAEALNERLSEGYKLLKKHGVRSTNELLAIQHDLQQKLNAVLNIQDSIREKELELKEAHTAAATLAMKISAARKKQIKPFESNVNSLLKQVGMPNAQLKVDLKTASEDALKEDGLDEITFLFDANRSGQLQPLSRVASGGELSRLMLCIKSLVARSIDLPTLIFDEIDTGISGEAARQVGIIMKDLSSSRQVICITHQPQIAGKADAHYFVYKDIVKNAVKTNIRKLDTEERITAIARMLSGEKPTAAAIENAKEMLN